MPKNTKQSCTKCNSISEIGLYKTKAMHILQQCEPVNSVIDILKYFIVTVLVSGLTIFP